MESILGRKIKEFRMKRGITQEELGNLVGVTTQAVSKWERGGTPDAELLPNIARALRVSIDALFDMEQEKGSRLEDMIIEELYSKEDKEAFERAVSLCIAIEFGLFRINSLKNKAAAEMMDSVNDENDHEYYSTLLTDDGLVRVRLSQNGRYFFIMPEPEMGYRSFLENIEDLSKTFRLLAEKDTLKILFFMYQRINKKSSSELIAEGVGVSVEKVEKLMEQLEEFNLVECSDVETVNGDLKAYAMHKEATIVPLLTFARELNVNKVFDFGYVYKREKPIF
ncbi:MAG: helix-turn-helix transcriptional regulator [Lachnospiraceae bacterium]|nr:helix-turn-helix transcriptional regulator [Lachnospiraceae bacterium]MBQ6996375.1 helix-turn-helix transcriptional regulator [Lachnospiraceae bacterium]